MFAKIRKLGSYDATEGKSTKPALRVSLLSMSVVFALAGCKIQIDTPPGGGVTTVSGNYSCDAGSTCVIDVYDTFFNEELVPVPDKGYRFVKWRKKSRALCGSETGNCFLSSADLDSHPKTRAVLESDQIFTLTPIFEKLPTLKEDNFETPQGRVIVDGGFDVSGSLVLNNSGDFNQVFEESDLQLRFDASGELTSLTGYTLMPRELSDNIGFKSDVRAEVGFFSGREINADDTYEIDLIDERKYLVFLIDQAIDLKLTNPADPSKKERLKISTPAAGKIVLIFDPADPMSYTYGEHALLGGYGQATSKKGLLPFNPDVDYPGLDRFEGHRYETGKFDVGIKAVDLLSLEGAMVIDDPQFSDIDFEDPFNSRIGYEAGYNGAAKLILSIFSFGLFEMDLLEASAQFGVNTERGNMSLASVLEPDEQKLPAWMPIEAGSQISTGFRADSEGDVSLDMGGQYRSTLPPADIEGSIQMTPDAVTLTGTVVDRITLPIAITFANQTTHARVGLNLEFQDEINQGLADSFDAAEREVDSALADLENAIGEYELELSLRGLRSALPAIVDGVIGQLNTVPGRVSSVVNSRVRSEIDKRNVCTFLGCFVSNKLRDSIASAAGSTARSRASSEIKPYLAEMNRLKSLSESADDEAFIAGIEAALRQAYSYRTFKRTISYEVNVAGLFKKTFSYPVNETILDNETAEKILFAADNVKRIPETGGLVISGQQILDQLPTEEIIDRVRSEVENGVSRIPGVSAVEYTVRNGDYSAKVIFSDGSDYAVDFNVLDPAEAIPGIADLVSKEMLSAAAP